MKENDGKKSFSQKHVVLTGVFLPMLARQLINSVLFISMGLLLLVWVIGHVTNATVTLKKVWSAVTQPDPVEFEAQAEQSAANETEPAAAEDANYEVQP